MINLNKLLKSLFYALYPETCVHCNCSLKEGEEQICFKCNLKIIDYKYSWINSNKNSITEKFNHRLSVSKGASFFLYESSSVVRSLIHELKYKENQAIGKWVVDYYKSLCTPSFFEDIDLIIPVPLHKKRLKQRGYNQVDIFCSSLADFSKVEYAPNLVKRIKYTTSQTKKSREERLNSMQNVFSVNEKHLVSEKHILIVDDVLTTGATIEAIGYELLEAGANKISVLTVALKV